MDSDEEKWANIMGDDEHVNNENAHMAKICLKQIPPEDYTLHQPVKATKKLKKSFYFMSDANTTLSNEDIHYQLLNTTDTLNNTTIREIFNENKTKLDKFDKLVKTPERCLSSTLEPYYSKNLKQSESYPNTFDISYDEIQQDVEHERILRKKELKTKIDYIKNEASHEDDHDHILTMSDVMPLTDDRLRPGQKRGNSVLEHIDSDFKPTICLTTRTYTRSKKKS